MSNKFSPAINYVLDDIIPDLAQQKARQVELHQCKDILLGNISTDFKNEVFNSFKNILLRNVAFETEISRLEILELEKELENSDSPLFLDYFTQLKNEVFHYFLEIQNSLKM